jgi:hypothetical protein
MRAIRSIRRMEGPIRDRADESPEIVRAAREMIKNHGKHAAGEAERRAKSLLASDQSGPATTWQVIADAVRRIEAGQHSTLR